MKRLLVYSHYNRNGELADHVRHQLAKMRAVSDRIVFTSNSPITASTRSEVLDLCDEFYQRENVGYDFAAWKECLERLGVERLRGYDSLILMNDTCFGPLQDIGAVFSEMEERKGDFWGITSHRGSPAGMPGTQGPIPHHLQSYFLVFNGPVLEHSGFWQFWKDVAPDADPETVIRESETQLTRVLTDLGFKADCYIRMGDRKIPNENYATWCPDLALEERTPFLKVKAFRIFPHPQFLKRKIQETTSYPVRLIEDHINSIFTPNDSVLVNPKTLVLDSRDSAPRAEVSTVGVHIHVFYLDILERILGRFPASQSRFRFYFSADSADKASRIEEMAGRFSITSDRMMVRVMPNRGRDVLPWLKFASELNQHELACHLHTKKTAWSSAWVGDSWMDQMIEELVAPADDIVRFLEQSPRVGIVIPDIPVAYQISLGNVDPWGGNRGMIQDLWRRMRCARELPLEGMALPLMPFGNMFWYRTRALEPLTCLGLRDTEFPEEPIPPDGTLAHAIERLSVYLSWAQGYDFRINRSSRQGCSFFEHSLHADHFRSGRIYHLENRVRTIERSRLWRLRSWVIARLKAPFGGPAANL